MSTKVSRVRISIPKRKIQQFCHRYDVQRMALFGSVLNKNFRPESDVDVLVVSSHFQTVPQDKRLDVLYDDIRDLTPDFHVFGLTPNEYHNLSPFVSIIEAKTQGIQLM